MRSVFYSFVLFGALLSAGSALAQNAVQGLDEQSIRLYLEKEAVGIDGRLEVSVGSIDPRLQLAPCARMEPYIPTGTRLWGRANIGVRCLEGASWNVFIPVHVRIYAPALVAARPLAARQELSEADVQIEEIELTRQTGAVLTDPAQLAGRILSRPLAAGQPLRADQLRTPPVVSAGDQVKLSYRGAGFTISSSAKALSAASDGQRVRVQTEAGKILSGIARPGRIVELSS
jgi:flagella basal body P-ring formation protein FlgA